jgi:hypothetical protein
MNDNQKATGISNPLPDAAAKTQTEWREYCAELIAEIDRLRAANAELREQRRALNLMVPVPEHVKQMAELSLEEVLAMSKGGPSLKELIKELEDDAKN